MCEFASWIEKDNKVYFLNSNQVYNTTRGKALQKWSGNIEDDKRGHGAIRYYYNLEGGVDMECTDFSTPDKFPDRIVKAIKEGKMEGMGCPKGLLLPNLYNDYETKCKLLNNDYETKRKLLDDDYWAKRNPLDDDYATKCKPLDDDYETKCKLLNNDYETKRKLLDDDYKTKHELLDDDYWAKRNPLDDDYATKCKPLNNDYETKRNLLYNDYWGLFAILENRNPKWV